MVWCGDEEVDMCWMLIVVIEQIEAFLGWFLWVVAVVTGYDVVCAIVALGVGDDVLV